MILRDTGSLKMAALKQAQETILTKSLSSSGLSSGKTKVFVQTQKYGLFQTLSSNNNQQKTLSKSKSKKLLAFLNDENLDVGIKEAIVMLIVSYFFEENATDKLTEIPYEGKSRGWDLSFDLEKFPNGLQSLLFRFYTTAKNQVDG